MGRHKENLTRSELFLIRRWSAPPAPWEEERITVWESRGPEKAGAAQTCLLKGPEPLTANGQGQRVSPRAGVQHAVSHRRNLSRSHQGLPYLEAEPWTRWPLHPIILGISCWASVWAMVQTSWPLHQKEAQYDIATEATESYLFHSDPLWTFLEGGISSQDQPQLRSSAITQLAV